MDQYEAAALRQAQHPAELAGLRAKLAANRDTAPLFDTPRYVRHLEQAYRFITRGRTRPQSPP